MTLVLLLLILALVLGGVGLAVHTLWWVLIIAAAFLVASAFTGYGRRGSRI
ncbi:MAG: hypothetical protein ACYDAD_07035 [Acidimicrobiales bacterium]